MTDHCGFALAALALLAAPGPTNTLLATSGASLGVMRSMPLIIAAAIGYVVATLAVAFILMPLAQASGAASIGMRIACGAFLAFAAWRLWTRDVAAAGDASSQFRRVMVATSLNPKGVIFATMVVPHLMPPRIAAAPYLAGVAALAAAVALAWIAAGAALRAGSGMDARLAQRIGAAVLALFAVLVAGSALTV
jgi:threonine/homoserine/homoserine lactone efflux protein